MCLFDNSVLCSSSILRTSPVKESVLSGPFTGSESGLNQCLVWALGPAKHLAEVMSVGGQTLPHLCGGYAASLTLRGRTNIEKHEYSDFGVLHAKTTYYRNK